MNYFAHGRLFTDQPYFLAGTAVPDWLSVVDRRVRVRSRQALPFVDDRDPCLAAVARGVVQHHQDDHWFHTTPAFVGLSLQLSKQLRTVLPDDDSFRPSFLGHVLVEVLLDAHLIAADPARLDAYYRAVDAVDPELIGSIVNCMAHRHTPDLAAWIPRFSTERFLYDYADDAKLSFRLGQVMRRAKLPSLPESFVSLIPQARAQVERRADELLARHGEQIQLLLFGGGTPLLAIVSQNGLVQHR